MLQTFNIILNHIAFLDGNSRIGRLMITPYLIILNLKVLLSGNGRDPKKCTDMCANYEPIRIDVSIICYFFDMRNRASMNKFGEM